MKIRHRMIIDKETVSKEFVLFLKQKNAKFLDDGTDLIVVYLYEEKEWRDELNELLEKEENLSMIECEYSKREMDEATWYTIRSKFRWEYPQPEDGYKGITYDDKSFCDGCGSGLHQKEAFKVKKEPKWGKRNFLMLFWVEDELFLSGIAKDVLQKANLSGYRFYEVMQYKKNVPIENMYQIYIENMLSEGLTNKHEVVKEIRDCKECGTLKYICNGRRMSFKKECFDGITSDIVKSYERFGEGHICAREILISKAFYQVLKNNKLDKDLVIEPIELV